MSNLKIMFLFSPKYFKTNLIVIVSLTCLLTVIAAIIAMLTQPKAEIPIEIISYDKPEFYSIEELFDTPVKNLESYEFSWINTFVSFMEMNYRYQSSKQGYSSNLNDYVEFSETYLKEMIAKECKKQNPSKACKFYNSSDANGRYSIALIPDLLKNSPEFEQGLIPTTNCPKSRGKYDCSKANPKEYIKYSVSTNGWAMNTQDIKLLLYKYKKPVLFSMPEPLNMKYTKCTDNSSEQCKSKTIICPDSISSDISYCSVTTERSYTMSGEFFVPDQIQAGEPMNFIIVGYSDTFVSSQGKLSVDYMKYPAGGFIAKSTLSKTVGNSINYYIGEQTSADAFKLCPNYRDPKNWLGVNLSCLQEKLDFNKCPAIASTSESVRSVPVTQLKCIDESYCSKADRYSLIQIPSDPHHNSLNYGGYPAIAHLNGTNVSLFIIKDTAVERLNDIFEPATVPDVDDTCGYWFIPYDLVDRMSRLSTKYLDRTIAFSFDVQFAEESMPGKYTSSSLEKSTKTYSGRKISSI